MNPSLWIMAASWEHEHNSNIAAARTLMQRAIRLMPENQLLWHEYFRLELIYIEKIKLRRRILGIAEQSDEQKDIEAMEVDAKEEDSIQLPALTGEDVDSWKEDRGESTKFKLSAEEAKALEEANNPILKGLLSKIIYDNAIQAIPHHLEFREKFIDIYREFSNTEEHIEYVYETIRRDMSQVPTARAYLAKRHLFVPKPEQEKDEQTQYISVSDPAFVPALRRCVEEFEGALNDLTGSDMWELYIDFILGCLANKAAGIKVFNTLEQLRNMFEEIEEDYDEDDDKEDISQIREWVIQRYIDKPLLVNKRKFHVRAYVLAKSNIEVYLYRDMLALFALKEYDLSQLEDNLIHLTNTCIQTEEKEFIEDESVKLFWELEEIKDKEKIFKQMKDILADIFDACTSEMTTFQAIPNAFELFGIDFLIDQDYNVYFLEANAFPDFKQTGHRLQHIIQELFDATTRVAIEPYFTNEEYQDEKLVKVYKKELLSL
ncbi:hypothetical protein RMATCC62417_12995 [Rhizopus microsporus]|nr:hypothetical protein RMATCC62417_12995 [Rhizopus microsporus]